MSNSNVQFKNNFPLMGVAILLTIGLAVANAAGWIHVALWVVFLPVMVVLAWSVFVLILIALVGGIGLGIIAATDANDRRKQRKRDKAVLDARARNGIVTPMRPRGMDDNK